MNVFDCIFNRRSIRKFEKKDVDDKLIGLILYAGTHAPSAGNVQEWRFVIIKDMEQKEKIAKAAWDQDFIKTAPVVIVVCADMEKISLKYGERGEKLYFAQDIGACVQNMLLAAYALDLGTCYVGAFDDKKISDILQLPNYIRPVAIIPIGYPAEKPDMPKRIPIENITYFNYYGKKYEIEYKPLLEYIKMAFKEIEEKVKLSLKYKKIKL